MPTRPRRRVDIAIDKPFRERLSRPWLRRVVSRTLDLAFPGESCQLGVVIAGDDTLKRLNREYRGVDEVTDVLSFSTTHQGHWEGDGEPSTVAWDGLFVLPPEEPHHLGELIISYPQASRQAGPGESGLEKELALLVVHGVLHLLGFDHVEEREEAEMKVREQEVVSSLFSPVRTP